MYHHLRWLFQFALPTCLLAIVMVPAMADETEFTLQFRREVGFDTGRFKTENRTESWDLEETAIIVCDVWDLHHCLNAVRRVEQLAPRLNEVLYSARQRGATIIHSPSDCMPAYKKHPARLRAMQTNTAARQPHEIASWCSVIPAEERGIWPIDQSDGGEDDDPEEHAKWAKELEQEGRNPGTPWAKQSDLLSIDPERDFISDRGNEVWNILQSRGIQNVILTGVHTNMCVIGRPFGLRQMVRNGKNVVLMRDMTDTMYNPKRWPYVSHFTGTDLIVAHIERYVCPTITSDQLIGGEPFRFAEDSRTSPSDLNSPFAAKYLTGEPISEEMFRARDLQKRWSLVRVPTDSSDLTTDPNGGSDAAWFRCTVKLPKAWADNLHLNTGTKTEVSAWLNGHALGRGTSLSIDPQFIVADDANLLVIRKANSVPSLTEAPQLKSNAGSLTLAGTWQIRVGNEEDNKNIPLPAKFGTSADIVFVPEDPLWQARPVTRRGEFTPGIEGPACDRDGNIFAVNFEREGTIGRVKSDGAAEVFVELPDGSIGNGIRFMRDGKQFFVADYKQHNVLRVNLQTKKVSVLGHNDSMNQPNDLAIAPDGKLYASDPNWGDSTGQLWRIDQDGTVTRLAEKMGTTNGIEVSPDGKTVYVNESVQRNIWAFDITSDHRLANKRLFKSFDDFGFDGMRCDVDGNLYVTRYGKGTVVKLSTAGEVLQEIDVLGDRPSNICFGGPDGRTAYVTEVDHTRLVRFRVDRPGRSWAEWTPKTAD